MFLGYEKGKFCSITISKEEIRASAKLTGIKGVVKGKRWMMGNLVHTHATR